jgi:hypothetical protein
LSLNNAPVNNHRGVGKADATPHAYFCTA